MLSLDSPKRRRIATPEVDIDDEDSEDESDDEEEVVQPGTSDADPVQAMTTKLRKKNMREMILSGDPDKMKRAGSLEIGAVVAHASGDRIRANALIDEHGGKALSIPDFDAIKSISKTRLGGIIRRIRDLKEEIQNKLPVGLFRSDRDEFLLAWMHHGLLYTNKIRPPHLMMRKSKDNSQDMLTDVAAHKCRHICMCYDISFSKFLGLTHAFILCGMTTH